MENPKDLVFFTEDTKISLKALDRLHRQQAFAAENAGTFARLSGREREVLSLVAKGHTNEAIGKRLFVSIHTIRTHRQNIRRQLDIHNVVEAVWWGACFDLV
jgi:DNA-binding CsgD family transcriptional regulator